ncbi:hypothetical protein MED121_04088 [Marinomonas sp. MED121]|nr:hypothetical protein MED121_04088 [Marinomonas sp. MED121]
MNRHFLVLYVCFFDLIGKIAVRFEANLLSYVKMLMKYTMKGDVASV